MVDISDTDLELAYHFQAGYSTLRQYMRLRVRDPVAVIEDQWALIQESDARMQKIANDLPGIVFTPNSPLSLAVRLLLVTGDFLDHLSRDSPYTVMTQLEMRASAWEAHIERLEDEEAEEYGL